MSILLYLHKYTYFSYKYSLQMGVNGREWAWMGLYGCDGVRAHGGTVKQGKQRHKWVGRVGFWGMYGREISRQNTYYVCLDING